MRDTIRSICYLLCLCLMGFGIADTAGHFMPDRPAVLPWAFSVMMIFLGFGFLRLVPKPKQPQPQMHRNHAQDIYEARQSNHVPVAKMLVLIVRQHDASNRPFYIMNMQGDCSGSGKEECDSCEGNGVLYDEEGVECEDCGGTGEIDCSYYNGSGEVDCDECSGSGEVDCEECDCDGEVTCPECDGEGVVDGDADYDSWSPMMNYIYPLPGSFEVPDDVMDKLNNTTIVCIDDNYYLALTGGGMDLSWEICESYINLGYYPPAHFCCLPRMAGRGTSSGDKAILAYCRESLRIKQRWDANDLNSLESNFDIPEAEFSRPW